MKTKAQKAKEIETGNSLLEKAKSIVFVDFSKTPTRQINILKNTLEESESKYRVIKKRLLEIVFKKKEIPVDFSQFSGQLAAIYSEKDITGPSGAAYRFSKENEKKFPFVLMGGYDVLTGTYYDLAQIKRVGQLPSRDILLAQLLGMLNAPVRSLAYTLSEIAKSKNG